MKDRIFIFSGYYGSGKTEVSTNFALRLKPHNEKVALADMDVVNPYFRSRDKGDMFESRGIRLIAPPSRINAADLPTLTAEIGGFIDNDEYKVVLDMGGDDVGTIPLGSVKNRIMSKGRFEVFIVANINRPFTKNAQGIEQMSEMIYKMSGLKPSAVISNTHLKQYTDEDMIMRGAEECAAFSKKNHLPFKYVTIPDFIYSDGLAEKISDRFNVEVLKLGLFYHTPWEEVSEEGNKVGGVD